MRPHYPRITHLRLGLPYPPRSSRHAPAIRTSVAMIRLQCQKRLSPREFQRVRDNSGWHQTHLRRVILQGSTAHSGAGSRGYSMTLTDDQRRACRQETILAIWERWTDGNPTLRQAMENGANPRSRREPLMAILRVMARMQGYGRTPSVRAAIAAGWAGVYLLRDA